LVNLLVLLPLAIVSAGIVAVLVLAGRVGDEAAALTDALRGFRALRPAVVELREETAQARLLAERLAAEHHRHRAGWPNRHRAG
jgi:hypothetical protein